MGKENFVHIDQIKKWNEIDGMYDLTKEEVEKLRKDVNHKEWVDEAMEVDVDPDAYIPEEMRMEVEEVLPRRSTRRRQQTKRADQFFSSEFLVMIAEPK